MFNKTWITSLLKISTTHILKEGLIKRITFLNSILIFFYLIVNCMNLTHYLNTEAFLCDDSPASLV